MVGIVLTTRIQREKSIAFVLSKTPIENCADFYNMWGDCDPEDYTDDTDE